MYYTLNGAFLEADWQLRQPATQPFSIKKVLIGILLLMFL